MAWSVSVRSAAKSKAAKVPRRGLLSRRSTMLGAPTINTLIVVYNVHKTSVQTTINSFFMRQNT